MIKLKWFDAATQDEYAEKIASKIKTALENEISSFAPDIAALFTEKGIVSEDKIKDFLKLKFSDVEKSPILSSYIARCDMISRIIVIIPHSGKHQSAGRKTSIRGKENANPYKERNNSRKERTSCII